jgi:hypothetical protein
VLLRTIAATFTRREDAERASRALVERAQVPRASIEAAGLAQYPGEDGEPTPARGGIVAARVAAELAEAVRASLVAAGGDILIDAAADGDGRKAH